MAWACAVLVREGVELVNQALGMNPAQAVLANIELPSIVADDYTVAQKAVGLDAAPQRTLGDDQHGVRIDLQGRDAEFFQVRRPGLLIGEVTVGMFGESGDHTAGQRAFAHIGERGVIDDVIAMAGAQQAEKIEAALRGGGGEGGEMGVADLGAKAVIGLVARAGVVHRDPGRARQPGAQYIARFVAKAILAGGQQADHLALGNVDAEGLQQCHQSRHRGLTLMILGEYEAPQLRPEMTSDAGRQRCRRHLAVGGLPALALEIDDVRTQHQVLHHEAGVALEARAGRRRGQPDLAFLVDRQLRARAPTPAPLLA